MPAAHALGLLASAIGCPIAQLYVDELVLAEVRVSDETLKRVKREGQPAAREVAERIAANLEALLVAEANRPPVDLRKGAWARPRRTRAERLAYEAEQAEKKAAGIAAAEAGRRAAKASRRDVS